MAVSIREVATAAGVSLSTVSQVMNGNDAARIATDTQERVRRVAQEMGYEPNRFARGLIRGRTDTLGLMISGLSNPFFVALLEQIEQRIYETDYQVLLDAAPSFGGSYRGHGRLRGWPVDGVLMWAHPDQTLADFVGASRAPVVYLGGRMRHDETDAVVFDLAAGARLLIEYVLGQGYRHIAHVTPYSEMVQDQGEERLQTYREFCLAGGVKFEVMTPEPRGETREAAWQVATQIVKRPAGKRPQVLLCHNDVMAVALYHGLRRAGLRVPEDVAIAGYDGIEEGRFLDRTLTTVCLPVEEMSRSAVTMLLQKISDDAAEDGKLRQIMIQPHLVVGETV